MKQLVILSGKGGAGKTSMAAAFAHLAHEGPHPVRAVIADADVDAANLELALRPQRLEIHPFIGGEVAVINSMSCAACGECDAACRFAAILPPNGSGRSAYTVDPIACEGCAACVLRCPHGAIHMRSQKAGEWYRSESRCGPLFHAELRPAQENSGKLVTLVKQQARLAALDGDYPLLIVDGPPGIGCPVISALSGADLALIVTEPTAAGIHDMARILETAAHFRVPALVCINKADIYPAGAVQIHTYCLEHGLELAGMVPYDETITQAAQAGKPVGAFRPESPAAKAIGEVWAATVRRLGIEAQA
jgi:MinD superfamily P-loop ATPase